MEKTLDLVRKLCWDKCADYRQVEGLPIKGKGEAYAIMSVADYGPSSQTLTFLDPEDDLGSLGIGADTQVDLITSCKFLSLSLSWNLSLSLSLFVIYLFPQNLFNSG